MISPKGCSLRPDPAILRPCLKIAVPNMLQRFATSLGYVFFAAMINSIGEVATAAHTIANTVESAFYIPAMVCRPLLPPSPATPTAPGTSSA